MTTLINLSAFPILTTSRLTLRELAPTDVDAIFTYLSDPEVARFLSTGPHHQIEQTRQLISFLASLFPNQAGLRWAITLNGHHQVIGTCGFHAWYPRYRAEVGYELARRYWGQGIMQEAVQAILSFGFGELGLHRVEAIVLVGNTTSARFLQKLGFQHEGVMQEYELVNGEFKDVWRFALIKR
jgi:ribosomal-protein-alanine N-acetyltransferase